MLLMTEDLIFLSLPKVLCFELPGSCEVIHKFPVYGSLNFSAGPTMSQLFPHTEFWKLVSTQMFMALSPFCLSVPGRFKTTLSKATVCCSSLPLKAVTTAGRTQSSLKCSRLNYKSQVDSNPPWIFTVLWWLYTPPHKVLPTCMIRL